MSRIKIQSDPGLEIEGEHLSERAREYAHLRQQERELEAKRKESGQRLLPLMEELQLKKTKVDYDAERDATVTVKERGKLTIDPAKLRKAIGARAYGRLTTAILDEEKVKAAIELGELDPNVVASCSQEFVTPYLEVRLTKKRGGR
jgi:hypothetical protein